jgi:hypothetical protein
MRAAAGHTAKDEGAMTDVQWVCPGCNHWSYNEQTDQLPKGDTRCSVCREDRLAYKNLGTETLSDDLKRLMRPLGSAGPSRVHFSQSPPIPSILLSFPSFLHVSPFPQSMYCDSRRKALPPGFKRIHSFALIRATSPHCADEKCDAMRRRPRQRRLGLRALHSWPG